MMPVIKCCVLIVSFFAIAVYGTSEVEDDDLTRNSRHKLLSSHLSSHHAHIGHHGHLGHHGHIKHLEHHAHIGHHGHKLHHKLSHLKLGFGLHHIHGRSAEEDLLIDHPSQEESSQFTDDNIHHQERDASHFSDEDHFHPKSGPFLDIWSKTQKSNVYHTAPVGGHVHHEEHTSQHLQNDHEDIPCSHSAIVDHNKPLLQHGPINHHSQIHSHEAGMHHPIHQESTHHGHHVSESRPFGHRGHGILIQKQLSIKKFRSADENNMEDGNDDTHAFDHVDENGAFGRKP